MKIRRIVTGSVISAVALGLATTVAFGQSNPTRPTTPTSTIPKPNFKELPGAEVPAGRPGAVRLQPPPGAQMYENEVAEITKKDPVTGKETTVTVPYVAEHRLIREADGSIGDWIVVPPDLGDRLAAAARSMP